MPGFFGKAIRGLGMLGKKKKPQPVKNPDLTDDGGPFVRRKRYQQKKSKERGDVYNKSGHVVGTPSPHRSKEAIKKYHGIK
jgi:hypothetical protein